MNLALAEMYVQGVSARKVIELLQNLVGPEVSISSTPSAAARSCLTRAYTPVWRAQLVGMRRRT